MTFTTYMIILSIGIYGMNINGLSCMSVNVNGIGDNKTKNGRERLQRKMKYLNELIDENGLNVILLQELRIHHNANGSLNVNWKKQFPDYEFYSNDDKETGILVYNKLQHKEVKDIKFRISKDQWTTWVMICNNGGKNILIASYYRSPSGNGNTRDLTKEISVIKKQYKVESFIIGGDFNAHSGMWDARFNGDHSQNAENVIGFMEDNQLVCINDNTKPTHVRQRDRSSDGIVDILGYNSVDITFISQDLISISNGWTTNSNNVFNGDVNSENVDNCEMDSDWVANMSDHFAMIWRINCKCIDENKRMTWRLNSSHWNDYVSKLEMYMDIWDKKYKKIKRCIVDYEYFIDDLTDFMSKSIRMATRTTVHYKLKKKMWCS